MNRLQKTITAKQKEELLNTLETRFASHPERHKGLNWADVQTRLEAKPDKLWSLFQMEATGGEPDVITTDAPGGEILFFDCAPESPAGRRSLCYDQEALESRKQHKPNNSAMAIAGEMGIELLTETQYRNLQELGVFDLKTSSWIATPPTIRALGGALFCDRRYNRVFVYHNGAESYYAARGFRGLLRV